MKYQKIIKLLGNRPNSSSKFRAKSCIEINDQALATITPIVKLMLKL